MSSPEFTIRNETVFDISVLGVLLEPKQKVNLLSIKTELEIRTGLLFGELYYKLMGRLLSIVEVSDWYSLGFSDDEMNVIMGTGLFRCAGTATDMVPYINMADGYINVKVIGGTSGGGTSTGGTALTTTADTTAFNRLLSSADTNVQAALNTINSACTVNTLTPFNTSIGYHNGSAGAYNVYVGWNAGANDVITANRNVVVGYEAGTTWDSGTPCEQNTYIGYQAMQYNVGIQCVAVGKNAGCGNATGSFVKCVFLGADSGADSNYRSGSIAIGYFARFNADNVCVIGDSGADAMNLGVCLGAPTARLHLPGGKTTAGGASLKLNSGALLASPEDGAIEHNNGHLYFTSGSTRTQLDGQNSTWTVITSTSHNMLANSAYIANNASRVALTLPTTAAVGSTIEITGMGAGGWRISQNANQLIYFGTVVTTTGTGGYLQSAATRDSVKLVCIVANTTFQVVSNVGTPTTA